MKPEERWLDKPRNVRKIVFGLYMGCALLLLADLFYVKSAHFFFEDWFGFYALFGFVGSLTLVLTAKELRRLLKRDEDYYDRGRPDDGD